MLINTAEYLQLLEGIKEEIAQARYKAALHANGDLIHLYYHIGQMINAHKNWGNHFIDMLSADIHLTYPESTGYSVRNLKYMAKFAASYSEEIVQQLVAQIPWGQNIVLMDKITERV